MNKLTYRKFTCSLLSVVFLFISVVNFNISVAAANEMSLLDIRMQYLPTIDASMKAHLRSIMFRGIEKGRQAGVLGQWGDSITHSMAYLGSMATYGINTPPSDGHDYLPILAWMSGVPTWIYNQLGNNPLYNYKGPSYGNDSGWKITNGLASIETAIANANPSWSLTMFGTNDINVSSWNAEIFALRYEEFILYNINEGIIPVVSTIPPRNGYDKDVLAINEVIRNVAGRMNIPVIDLYCLFMELHPNDWNSVLLGDGIHPSHTYNSSDLSDAALTNDGYNIRSILTADMAEKLRRIVFDNGTPDGTDLTTVYITSDTHPYNTVVNNMSAVFTVHHDNGAAPDSYSWVLDRNPYTIPDTTSDGTSPTITQNIQEEGIWYFHVRAANNDIWGPADHYLVSVTESPTVFIRRNGNTPNTVKDTRITSSWGGDDNFGGSEKIDMYNDDSVPRSRGLLQFDLTNVSPENIISAKLLLYPYEVFSRSFNYDLYTITEEWTEGTGTSNNNNNSGVVWNDNLTFTDTPVYTGSVNQETTCIEVDITNLVESWLDGSIPNYGIMIQHNTRWNSMVLISSEYGNTNKRPALVIKYSSQANPKPAAPILTGTSAGNQFATLSWNAVEGAASYIISYGTEPGNYTQSKTVGNITQCTVTGLQNDTPYYFAAQAVSAGGTASELSNVVNTQPVAVAENRPNYVKNENIVHPLIYVSNNGDNLINNGSESSPLRTINYALQQAEPGDTIIVKPGTYYEYNIGSFAGGNTGGEENGWITVQSEVLHGAVIDALGTTESEAIRCSEKGYIIFDGFEVRNSGSNLIHADTASHHIIFRNLLAHDAGPGGDVMKFNQAANITVENCEAYKPGMRVQSSETVYQELIGFLDVDNAIVRNSLFHDAGNIAIYSKGGSRNTVFENNIIIGNTSMANPLDALVGIGGWTSSIFFVNGDVYESYDMIVRNNLIIGAKGEAIGVYNSSGARIYNNTIVDAARAGIFFRMGNGPEGNSHEITNTQAFNNIFTNMDGTMITPFMRQNNQSSLAVTNFTHGNNLFWNNGLAIPSGDTSSMLAIGGDAITASNGSIGGNPRLLNPDHTLDQLAEMSYNDIATLYSITAGSSAIGMVPRSNYALKDFYGVDRQATTDAGAILYTQAQNIPTAPVLQSAKENDSSVLLRWSAVQGAESYTINYGTGSGAYTQSVPAGAATSYKITGLTNGTQYCFAVTASNAHGSSPFSNELATTPKVAASQDEMSMEIVSSQQSVRSGQEFDITIRATNASDLYAYLADFEYEPQKFELISGQLFESESNFTLLSTISDPNACGKLKILATLTGNIEGVTGEVVNLVKLVFKPKLAAGTGIFIIKAGSSLSNSESQVSVLATDMEINVSIVSGYDLNSDGVTNIGDLVLVAAAVGTSSGNSGYNAILDLNSDGTINNADLLIISQILLI